MAYLIFNFLTLFVIKTYDFFYQSRLSRYLLTFPLIFLLSLLPSLQYGVGTDYFSYERIFNNPNILEHYNTNNELVFYYLVKFINSLTLDSKVFFSFISVFQSILIICTFNILKRNGYNLTVLFFLFFTVTNLLHTQMNIIRASLAIYFFVISFLYKIEKKYLLCLLAVVLSVFSHKSAYAILPFVLIPTHWYSLLYKKALAIYLVTFIVFFINPMQPIVDYIVSTFFPYYSLYLEDGNFGEVSIVNLFTKAYYAPIILYFLFNIKNLTLNYFSKVLIGLWVITANLYILVYHYDFFSRINYFFVYFYIVPLYFSLKYAYKTKRKILLLFMSIMILMPYILKVVIFPVAEFKYSTFLF
ncbi:MULTISPECIES: EpsG family protein [unclassified Providencia]|uniref:EpsG family protein n=1 Tax=unclassified Providencia TaxID=2633465 RepID=UPI003FA7D8A1